MYVFSRVVNLPSSSFLCAIGVRRHPPVVGDCGGVLLRERTGDVDIKS